MFWLSGSVPSPTDRGALLWVDAIVHVGQIRGLAEPLRDRHRRFHRLLLQIIERGQQADVFRTDDAASSARMLASLLTGLAVDVAGHRILERPEAIAIARRACEQELGVRSLVQTSRASHLTA